MKRFIFASTQSIYGIAQNDSELDEDNSFKNPQTAYAKSKLKAEIEILGMSDSYFTTTSLRPSTVFGWGARLRSDIVFNNLLLSGLIHNRIDVHSDGTPWRPVVHIQDLCAAIEICLTSKPDLIAGNSFNIGIINGNYTVRQLAEAAQNVLNGIPVRFNTERIVDPRSYKVSFFKARDVLGFEAKIDLISGSKEIIDNSKSLLSKGVDLLGPLTNRLAQMKNLLTKNKIDSSLRFTKN